MALKKTLAERLFNITKVSRQTLSGCRVSAAQSARNQVVRDTSRSTIDPDPGDSGVFRRFLHRRAILSPESQPAPLIRENLRDRLRALDIVRDRIRLDGLVPPLPLAPAPEEKEPALTAVDVRKLLRVAQMEMVKSRLREIREIWAPYEELERLCGEGCSDPEEGSRIAKLLDESGNVVVLGKMVLLQPELVTKAMAGLIPLPEPGPHDPRRKELEELEKQKAEIDRAAESKVRSELWAGLGFLVAQTAAFMRLTFWELSWDVMEPICFYVTSIYFMAGYTFFLRTSREPSFEGFYNSRFLAKQKRLMKARNFDIGRYEELSRAFHNHPHMGGTLFPAAAAAAAAAPPAASFSEERAQAGLLR